MSAFSSKFSKAADLFMILMRCCSLIFQIKFLLSNFSTTPLLSDSQFVTFVTTREWSLLHSTLPKDQTLAVIECCILSVETQSVDCALSHQNSKCIYECHDVGTL
jgi:hypothetical protein